MLIVGYVNFDGLAAPETWAFGGEQKIVVREQPGGSIFYQPRGYFPSTEQTWEGSFTTDDSEYKAQLVDGYCQSGESVEVTFNQYTLYCFVEKFEWKWARSEWIDFSITLRRDFSKTKKDESTSGPIENVMEKSEPASSGAVPKTYAVAEGDSLWRIGQQFGVSVDQLYADNRDVIGGNPSLIYPGQTLVINT